MVKIRIKPKVETTNKREREWVQQEEEEKRCEKHCEKQCDEIRNLRFELEMMKEAMTEMRRHINEMQQMQHMQIQAHVRGPVESHRAHIHYDCEKSLTDLDEWMSGLELTLEDLETMFESNDMVDWASKFIVADLKQRSGHPHPLCAVKGSRNELLIYDKVAWRKMTDQDFESTIVNKVFKKLLAAFTAWKNENYNKILTSEHFSTLYHSNYARILSFNENPSKLKMKLFHML